jgi:hypothetical protein
MQGNTAGDDPKKKKEKNTHTGTFSKIRHVGSG